jgi:hypothetical protein
MAIRWRTFKMIGPDDQDFSLSSIKRSLIRSMSQMIDPYAHQVQWG